MTPSQLRAFAAVVRLGSVRSAALELEVTEAAVSLHVGQLRKELGDRLFVRTAAGLAFTPGGLRLAGRAGELLGLQNRTVLEVKQAGNGRRLLRVAASSLFAEHAAPGLIERFAGRADDLDVELSLHPPDDFGRLLLTRAVDVAIGPRPAEVGPAITAKPFLNYQVLTVASPDHPIARISAGRSELRRQTWLLGPSGATGTGLIPDIVRRLEVPEDRLEIFQNHAAAVEEVKRGRGLTVAVAFAVSQSLARGDLVRVSGPGLHAEGVWCVFTLADHTGVPAAEELARFVTTPRAIQAMLRGTGVTPGRFRPAIHVTLWS